MADNGLQVVLADGSTVNLRSLDLGSGVHLQLAGPQVPETAIRPANATDYRFTVDAAAAKALVPPAGARFARVRIFHSAQSQVLRCYYTSDGTAPANTGANAFGYLLHGEMVVVNIASLANFKMIGESGMTGSFEAYVEYLKW